MKTSITVDNRKIEAYSGENLLQACLENGIYIPHLCYIKDIQRPLASCRLCFVEIEGEKAPVTACTQTVIGGMIVRTDTETVRQLQRRGLELLLSVHDVDCGHCPANKRCELQTLARFLKVKLKPDAFDRHLKDAGVIDSHPVLEYYPNRCILCGKCEYICKERTDRPILSFIKRGLNTEISLYWHKDDDLPCADCLACVDICPVKALVAKTQS